MTGSMLLAVRDGVHREILEGSGTAVLVRDRAMTSAPAAGTPEGIAFERLVASPAPADALDAAAGAAGAQGLARWLLWSGRALARGLIAYRAVDSDGELLAEFVPVRPDAPDLARSLEDAAPPDRLALSRFAVLHRRDGGLVMESPLGSARATLSSRAASLVTALDGVRSVESVAGRDADPDAARMLLVALADCGLLVEPDEAGSFEEDSDPALSQWEPHDLAMHARTRTVRVDEPRGGTYRFADRRPAPPALRHPGGAPSIPLSRPDLERLLSEDVPLARVMEERTSRRSLAPMDAARLGEFLFRTVRVRRQIPAGDHPRAYARTDRPHPAAGGMYELATYIAVSACDGIPPGLYRYDPVAHGLDPIAPAGPPVERLLEDARSAAVTESRPPVLVILAADFARLSWKYEGIAYAATLKNVGVLFATMQLVATAMGLGSCPLGGGDSDAFADATGLDRLEESSVGELMLGS